MREDLIERLRWEADISARPGQMDRLNALADEFAAALGAAREDERKWRFAANGPQGTFYTDDLLLAASILRAYDKDDDWTVTDVVCPRPMVTLEAAMKDAIVRARGKETPDGDTKQEEA